MRKRIIAGNWKMYKTAEEARRFAEEVKGKVPVSEQWKRLFVHLHYILQNLFKLQKARSLDIGAQTMHDEKEGAFTGEVSPAMLQSIGVRLCRYWSFRTSSIFQ